MLSTLSLNLCASNLPQLSGNIYCVGRNYREHAQELQNEVPSEPVIFLKAASSLRPLATGPLAFATETFHHEIELVVLLGQHLPLNSKSSEAAIGAISLGIDLTRRGVQNLLKQKSLPWTIAKSFAGAALIHPFKTAAENLERSPWQNIDFALAINGEEKQRGHTDQMIFSFTQIMDYLLMHQELQPGDIIYTGTPAGVGPVKKGDQLRLTSQALKIDAFGIL